MLAFSLHPLKPALKPVRDGDLLLASSGCENEAGSPPEAISSSVKSSSMMAVLLEAGGGADVAFGVILIHEGFLGGRYHGIACCFTCWVAEWWLGIRRFGGENGHVTISGTRTS